MKKNPNLNRKKAPDTSRRNRLWAAIRWYLLLFFAASFLGYVWEVFLFLWKEGAFYNRGFFRGPWLPVYGLGAVLFYLCLHWLKDRPCYVFLLSLMLGSGVELSTGILLDVVWGLRYWDYRTSFANLNGYICLSSALAFGLAGVLWVCLFTRQLALFWQSLSAHFQSLILSLLLTVFIVDTAAALVFPNTGYGVTF